MYRATVAFNDFKDNNRSYEAGEEYPRPGLRVTKARLTELATDANASGFPLIEEVEPPKPPRKRVKADA